MNFQLQVMDVWHNGEIAVHMHMYVKKITFSSHAGKV